MTAGRGGTATGLQQHSPKQQLGARVGGGGDAGIGMPAIPPTPAATPGAAGMRPLVPCAMEPVPAIRPILDMGQRAMKTMGLANDAESAKVNHNPHAAMIVRDRAERRIGRKR